MRLIAAFAGPSTYAAVRQPPRRLVFGPPARDFHASCSSLKKRRVESVEEDFDSSYSDDAVTDALFDVSSSTSTSSSGGQQDRPAFRAMTKDRILSVARLTGDEQRRASTALKVFNLVQVARFSDTPAELEELRGLMRTWRVLGKRVTPQAAKEIVGRCCNLGRPDLAQELMLGRVQYGMPDVSEQLQQKVKDALISFAPPQAAAAASQMEAA